LKLIDYSESNSDAPTKEEEDKSKSDDVQEVVVEDLGGVEEIDGQEIPAETFDTEGNKGFESFAPIGDYIDVGAATTHVEATDTDDNNGKDVQSIPTEVPADLDFIQEDCNNVEDGMEEEGNEEGNNSDVLT